MRSRRWAFVLTLTRFILATLLLWTRKGMPKLLSLSVLRLFAMIVALSCLHSEAHATRLEPVQLSIPIPAQGGGSSFETFSVVCSGWSVSVDQPWVSAFLQQDADGCVVQYVSTQANPSGVSRTFTSTVNALTEFDTPFIYQVTGAQAGASDLRITTVSLPDANLCQAQSYSVLLTASGGSPGGYTWSTSSGLPPGFSLNQNTGILSGTNYATVIAQPYHFTVTVRDTAGNTASKPLSIRIINFDLNVESFKPVQVIFNEPLIQGKTTAFVTTFGLNKCAATVPFPTVEAEVTFEGRTQTKLLDSSLFKPEQDHFVAELVFTPFQPQGLGVELATVTVNPSGPTHIAETNENNNNDSQDVNVVAARPIRLVYVPVNDCLGGGCWGNLNNFSNAMAQSLTFVKATYPVTSITSSVSKGISPLPSNLKSAVNADDLLVASAGFLADPSANKAVAVVPANYFAYHGLYGTAGLTIGYFLGSPPSKQSYNTLVREFDPSNPLIPEVGPTTAHELGHAFGIHDDGVGGLGEEYQVYPVAAPAAAGYWVEKNMPIANTSQTPFYCFMGAKNDTNSWVDSTHYEFLMGALPVSSVPLSQLTTTSTSMNSTATPPGGIHSSDMMAVAQLTPATQGSTTPVIAVSGILHADDKLEPASWFFSPSGMADTGSNGQYELDVMDWLGRVLAANSFDVQFIESNDKQIGSLPVQQIPLFARLLFPASGRTLRLQHNGTPIFILDANIKLLSDAINALPDCAFISTPAAYRSALLNDLQSIAAAENGGGLMLQNAINTMSTHFQQWVTNVCTTSAVQLDRTTVLALMAETSNRLGSGTRLPGDINGDGKVDCADVAVVRGAFGSRSGQSAYDGRADVNVDGVVDIRDLAFVSQRLPVGTRCQ